MPEVTKNIPRSLIRLIDKFLIAKNNAFQSLETILLREVQASVKQRAYRTGALFESIELRAKRFVTFETIEVFSILFYASFIERGTRFMKARRPFALGVIEARSKIESSFVRIFADMFRGLTV